MNQWAMIILLQAICIGAMVAVLSIWDWRRRHTQGRDPLQDRLLRSPGESLRKRLETIDQGIMEKLMLFCLVGVVYGFALQWEVAVDHSESTKSARTALTTAAFLLVQAWLLYGLVRLLSEWSRCRLGLRGERAVGEVLNELLRDDCYVFHDFPADPKWNVDHVIVAPSGVYAIETKVRRKHAVSKPNAKDYEIVYDGERLHFPRGEHGDALEQARNNAQWLSAWLSKSTGDPVKVEPILTFPGWWVTRRGNGGVRVLNPKEIRTVVLDRKRPTLDPKLIDRVVFQLDQKCRDVEF
jgi:hypothetical protein